MALNILEAHHSIRHGHPGRLSEDTVKPLEEFGQVEKSEARWQGNPVGDDVNRRPSVYLGVLTDTEYEAVSGHLRALERYRDNKAVTPSVALTWLSAIGDDLHAKVAKAGLCEPRLNRACVLSPGSIRRNLHRAQGRWQALPE